MSKNVISNLGLQIPRKMRLWGSTVYVRQGQVIARPARQHEKRSNTLPQFKQRQKMRHTMALWKMLRFCETIFTMRRNAYQNFASLANRLPIVYVKRVTMHQASFLMPGIPISDGVLPSFEQKLGEVNGVPALITNFTLKELYSNTRWFLYTARQNIECDVPRVRFSRREIYKENFVVEDGHLALVGEEYADDMKGWALVMVKKDQCSPQTIVTRCTLYQQYTTQEALEAAADSYGGLTETPFLSPR